MKTQRKRKFVVGTQVPLGNRRTDGVGDLVGQALLPCTNVLAMIEAAVKFGVSAQELEKYKTSKLHLGVLRMAIGNRMRAVQRKKDALAFREKLKRRRSGARDYEVLT